MKNRLILGAVTIAGAVLLTLISSLAQAQGLSAPSRKQVEVDEGVAEELIESDLSSQFVSDFSMFAGSCRVGPRASDVIFTCFGFGFPSASPTTVNCQLRNSPFDPTAYPDQFACQVIRTSPGSVTVRIRRMDDGTGSSGWGQDLRLNLLIIN